jgi:Protein of unknown function (DUF2934)
MLGFVGAILKGQRRSPPMTKTLIPTPVRKPQLLPNPDLEEQIRQRAYQLYEQRGRENGHALDDWLAAESEIAQMTGKIAA